MAGRPSRYEVEAEIAQLNGGRLASLELGRWIAGTWAWSIFFTLTLADHREGHRYGFARGVTEAESFLHRWSAGAIEGRGGYWWAAMEQHRDRSTPHFHGLAGGFSEEPRRVAMWAEWRAITTETDRFTGVTVSSRCQVVPVRDAVGVGVYVAKYVNKGLGKVYTGGSLDARRLGAPWAL